MSETVGQAVEQVAAPKMITPISHGPVRPDPLLCWDRQRIRDVPRSCVCTWSWGRPLLRWVRIGPRADCPWHGGSWSAEVRDQR